MSESVLRVCLKLHAQFLHTTYKELQKAETFSRSGNVSVNANANVRGGDPTKNCVYVCAFRAS